MADVTFAGMASNQCLVSDINPQQGPDGNASGFSHEFGSGFSLLGKVTSPAGSATSNGVNFDWTFDQTSGTTGTWSLMTDQEATFDVVFAMHAGGYGGAFLFDDQSTVASVLYANTWEINWLDNGSQVLDHSNLTLYVRNVDTVTPIPEPSTYALMLASLGVVGLMARRRRAAQ